MSKDIVQRLLTFVPVESGELYQVLFEAAAEIERLRRTVDDRDEWNHHLSQLMSHLLLAIPRPFRVAVHRKAVRRVEKEARRG